MTRIFEIEHIIDEMYSAKQLEYAERIRTNDVDNEMQK